MNATFNRRDFLATSAAGLVLPGLLTAQDTKPKEEPISFFLVGDTHFLANKEDTTKLDERSANVTAGLVNVLNKLPGSEIPMTAGGGTVLAPKGVIHAGDCIDTGDKANVKMQETEWAAFTDAYGLTGKEGKLKYPVYEVHGNHDSPRGDGLAVKKIITRNTNRSAVNHISKNGLHYAWSWGHVRFINLGIVVGQVADVKRKRRYTPLDSLEFLKKDLAEFVGTKGTPVVITHHVDMLRYAQPLTIEDKKAESMEWDPADVSGYYETIKPFNIAAILYGHTHARNVYRWNGSAKAAPNGIPTFNVDNSSHFSGKLQAFFYFEIRSEGVTVREYQTADAWETGSWTPQVWKTAISK